MERSEFERRAAEAAAVVGDRGGLAVSERRFYGRYYDYLDALRESGMTNMCDAAPRLARAFSLDRKLASEILLEWMQAALAGGGEATTNVRTAERILSEIEGKEVNSMKLIIETPDTETARILAQVAVKLGCGVETDDGSYFGLCDRCKQETLVYDHRFSGLHCAGCFAEEFGE